MKAPSRKKRASRPRASKPRLRLVSAEAFADPTEDPVRRAEETQHHDAEPILPPGDERLPLSDHLDVLRGLIVRALLVTAVALAFTYTYCDFFMALLQRPLLKYFPADQQFLYFTGIADKFVVYLQVSLVTAVFLTVPYHLYLVWQFIKPALFKRERKFAVPFLILGTISFAVGLTFGYFAVIPMGYEFLIQFGTGGLAGQLRPMITITEYIPMTLKILGVVGLVFELPVVLMILGALGVVTPQLLKNFRRYAFMGLTVLSAILTPSPDALSMIIVAVPMCVLYEVSIWGVRFVQRFREVDSPAEA